MEVFVVQQQLLYSLHLKKRKKKKQPEVQH